MTDAWRARRRWVVAATVAVLLGAGGCGGDGGDAVPTTSSSSTATRPTSTTTSTAPERPASTTTTAFDPASVEGQVEAAYLRSWDVYADAVYNLELNEQALAEVYGEPYLSRLTEEISSRISEGRAALVDIEQQYTIQVDSPQLAYVVDEYVNHQRLIDPVTKEFVEDDPNEVLVDLVTVQLLEGVWRVVDIQKVQ